MKAGAILFFLFISGCVHSVKVPPPPETKPSDSFSHPLPGAKVLSPFGKRGGRFHTGVDLQIGRSGGEFILAAREGVVTRAQTMNGYGRMVEVRHADGFSTRYAHMQKILVKKNQRVKRADKLGTVGRTGRATTPHLHFEILTPKFRYANPKDFL